MISEAICVRNRTEFKAVILVEACIGSVFTANKGFSYLVYCFSSPKILESGFILDMMKLLLLFFFLVNYPFRSRYIYL